MATADLTDAAREAFVAFLHAFGFETDDSAHLAALVADGLETLPIGGYVHVIHAT